MKSRQEKISALIYRLTELSKQSATQVEIAKDYEASSPDPREREHLQIVGVLATSASRQLASAAHKLLQLAPKVEAEHEPVEHK